MRARLDHGDKLPTVHQNDPTSPTKFLGRLSWERDMLDCKTGGTPHRSKPASVAPCAPAPSKLLLPIPSSNAVRAAATLQASQPSPRTLTKQAKTATGSRPMTMDESLDEVERLLEQHMRQHKEIQRRRRLPSVNEQPLTSRRTFVFAPLDDPRMLAEMAAHDAVDARDGSTSLDAELDAERDPAGGSVQRKYFGPEARAAFYQKYQNLHNKPQLFVERDVQTESIKLGTLRQDSQISPSRRSTTLRRPSNLRRSLPTLEQAQILLGGDGTSMTSAAQRSPRALFLGACLAANQAAPTLVLRKERYSRAFDFSHQGLGDDSIVRFAACLPELPLVESINVADNRLTNAGISCLLRALENKPNLTSLDVSANEVGTNAASVLRGYLRSTLCTLKVLALNKVGLSDRECARLAQALKHNKSVDQLSLSGNMVGLHRIIEVNDDCDDSDEDEEVDDGETPPRFATGGQSVGTMLTANLTLQHLDLSWNQLRDVGSAPIASALPMNFHLRELDLSYNSLGNTGALTLAQALRSGARLKKLVLSYNGISPRGGVGLASGLAANAALLMLVLDGNPLGTQGGKALMHASCASRPGADATAPVCQLSLQDCSLDISAPMMSATGGEQLHVFNPTDPAGDYVLDLSDAYEHMIAHELLRLAISHPNRYHFTKLEYAPASQGRVQPIKLELAKCRVRSTPGEDAVDNKNLSSSPENLSLSPVEVMFRRMDEDGSGSIERGELMNALSSCGLNVSHEQLGHILREYDYDKSGSLQKREFADLFARVGFELVDTDSSGSLDECELRRVFQLLGVQEDAEKDDAVARMIARYDLDGSGEIDVYEFLEFMTSEVFIVSNDHKKDKSDDDSSMKLEICEVGSGKVWQIPAIGELTADLVHSGSGIDHTEDTTDSQAPDDGRNIEDSNRSLALMSDVILARILANASSSSRNVTEQDEFLFNVLADSGMYLSAAQCEQLLARRGVSTTGTRPGRRLAAIAKMLPQIIDRREVSSLVTRVADIQNQWHERLALRHWLGGSLHSVLLGSLTNAYSFDLTRNDHREALRRLALIAQDEKQFSRWRSGRADTSQSGNWENFRLATLDGESVLLSSRYILNKLLAATQERMASQSSSPSKLSFYYVSTTRPPRGTKWLSQRRFEQLQTVLSQPLGEKELSPLHEEVDNEKFSSSIGDKKRAQALLHWDLVRSSVVAQSGAGQKKRNAFGEAMTQVTNTVEGLHRKLLLLEVLVTDRWLSSYQAQELVDAFPNAVKARARAACLVFSRVVDLENFIQIYDNLSSEDQEECVRRLGWLNILDPLQPDRQYPPLDLSVHDERKLVQILAHLALQEGACWKDASYRGVGTFTADGQEIQDRPASTLPPPGWGRSGAVGVDSLKHHGTVCLRYHSENADTSEQETANAVRDTARRALRDRVLCGSRLFL